jgi:CBS domain-containing protein
VLERFAESGGLLPVVRRDDARKVEGVITIADIHRFGARRRADVGRSPVPTGHGAPPG